MTIKISDQFPKSHPELACKLNGNQYNQRVPVYRINMATCDVFIS